MIQLQGRGRKFGRQRHCLRAQQTQRWASGTTHCSMDRASRFWLRPPWTGLRARFQHQGPPRTGLRHGDAVIAAAKSTDSRLAPALSSRLLSLPGARQWPEPYLHACWCWTPLRRVASRAGDERHPLTNAMSCAGHRTTLSPCHHAAVTQTLGSKPSARTRERCSKTRAAPGPGWLG